MEKTVGKTNGEEKKKTQLETLGAVYTGILNNKKNRGITLIALVVTILFSYV